MITDHNWVTFIHEFFKVERTTATREWILHVSSGWNHIKNEAGCTCSYTWYSGPEFCENYLSIQEAKAQFRIEHPELELNEEEFDARFNAAHEVKITASEDSSEANSSVDNYIGALRVDEPTNELMADDKQQ